MIFVFEIPIRDSKKIAKKEQIMLFSNLCNFNTYAENSLTIQNFKKLPDIFQFVNCLVPIQKNVFQGLLSCIWSASYEITHLPVQSIAT